MHEKIFDYVLANYDIALGVDEIMYIVTNNLCTNKYMEANYGLVS